MKASLPVVSPVLLMLMALLMACGLPAALGGADAGMEETRIALGVQQTSLAIQQSTLDAAQSGISIPQDTQDVLPTYTPFPTYTSYPTVELPLVESTSQPAANMDERIRGANVLIFEDIWGEWDISADRRVSDAVARMGFSGGKVINTGDAMGTFKEELLNGTTWDLIIVSAERRDSIQGEFWDYILLHLDQKTALIAEVWYLDDTANGKVAPFLNECGVDLQSDWVREPDDNVLDYSILTLDTTHPVFNEPNSGISLVTPTVYWMWDAGDRIKLTSSGDAVLLAGTHIDHHSDYGALAACMEGRVILQTFSTHDYRYDQTTPLWENYIHYTLTNHFLALE